ncbi:conserved hypothetical protein [Pseudomonas sp. 8Z]|uniref:DUF6279 family lipoprotein n=1 Tax=Pseudomonas sp. 8Z TaxID=2653166 RepID=UPI0012F38121|nr:DUF6279 family lipoprotein [Pseudomonas sp. 8Z]VXD05119.1 conserved hypothetical protein [Pseudomonas sp. 8Z]
MHKFWLSLLALPLLLVACSRIDLAYRNLDWLIPWKLDDYLALDEQQREWLKPRLQEHLNWHCSVELPRYLLWLRDTQALLNDPAPARLNAQLNEFDLALQRIAVQITPNATELLSGLEPNQVTQLFAALDEQNAELQKTFLTPTLPEQIELRIARMNERLEPWLGELNAQQLSSVEAWAEEIGAQNTVWLENRAAWQQALREALENRHADDFSPRMQALLQERERFYTQAYRARYASNREAMVQLFADLLSQAERDQLERANNRLEELHDDLAAQQCNVTSESVASAR